MPAPAELAAHFPQYEMGDSLGQGGMGLVYRARHRTLGRAVALKLLAPEIAHRAGFAERFAREARVLATLTHPNIVSIYEFGQAGPWFFFAMELIDGVSLRHMLRAETIEARVALDIVAQLCDALQYAHDHGVVHRDIKPENVLVDRSGKIKILDFGLSKMVGAAPGETLTRSDQVMGTPHYMAPEQWEKPASVDHRADIYALGVVFYELLTGELPLGRFAPPSHKVQLDVRLDEVVLRTLAKEPELRYQRASEVKTDVERVHTPVAQPQVPEPALSSSPGPLRRPRRRQRKLGLIDRTLVQVGLLDAHVRASPASAAAPAPASPARARVTAADQRREREKLPLVLVLLIALGVLSVLLTLLLFFSLT